MRLYERKLDGDLQVFSSLLSTCCSGIVLLAVNSAEIKKGLFSLPTSRNTTYTVVTLLCGGF